MSASRLPALALMVHDVDGPEGPIGSVAEAGLSIPIERVIETVEGLRGDGYRFVKLAEFIDSRDRGGVALLTFDDGYVRVRTRALPVLRGLDVPALCFLVTGTLDEITDCTPIWIFSLRDALPNAPTEAKARLEADSVVRRFLDELRVATLEEVLARPAASLYPVFHPRLSYEELDHIRGVLAELGILKRMTLDREAVFEMRRSSVFEFGAHSIAHRNLVQVSAAEARRRVEESIRYVATLTGADPREVAFAYPYGQASLATRRAVDRYGRIGFTVAERACLRGDSLSLLPRLSLDATVLDRARRPPRYASLLRERVQIRTAPLRERARRVKGLLRRTLARPPA